MEQTTAHVPADEEWDQLAQGRKKWATIFEDGMRPVTDRLLELAMVGEGQRVLDVGTGTGEPALSAARVVGPKGLVVGVDISPAMIRIAESEAKKTGVKNVHFAVLDAQALDADLGPFDAVLSRFVLMFLPDLQAALTGIRRLMVEGGRFAMAVLGPPEKTPMVSIMVEAAKNQKPLRNRSSGALDVFGLSCPETLEAALFEAGFSEVKTEILTTRQTFSGVAEFIDFQIDTNAQFKRHLADGSGELRREAVRRISLAARPYLSSGGSLDLVGESVLAVAVL